LAQHKSAAQLSSAETRAEKAAAAAEAAEHTAEHFKVETQAAQRRAEAAEQRCSEKVTALTVAESTCADLQQQLAAMAQESHGLRREQVRACELEGVHPATVCFSIYTILSGALQSFQEPAKQLYTMYKSYRTT
jgi:uncharacterized membrane protein YdbT with pleckstrin-like domain